MTKKTGFFELDSHLHAIEIVYEELKEINKRKKKFKGPLDEDTLQRLDKLVRIYGNLMGTYKDTDSLRKQLAESGDEGSNDGEEDGAPE